MKITDISLPIYNNMWSYKPEWANSVSSICETNKGDAGTVYRFNLVSHTGTYIETSQHKLKNNKLLNHLDLDSFYKKCKVIVVNNLKGKQISLAAIKNELTKKKLKIVKGDYVIIATGYGKNHNGKNYLQASPYFEPALMGWLNEKQIGLIGTDTPIIENLEEPYSPVIKMFKANPKLLLLAPLLIDTKKIKTGIYTLSCLPLPIKNISGSQCRAVLIK